jgi:hypothetical protein
LLQPDDGLLGNQADAYASGYHGGGARLERQL